MFTVSHNFTNTVHNESRQEDTPNNELCAQHRKTRNDERRDLDFGCYSKTIKQNSIKFLCVILLIKFVPVWTLHVPYIYFMKFLHKSCTLCILYIGRKRQDNIRFFFRRIIIYVPAGFWTASTTTLWFFFLLHAVSII